MTPRERLKTCLAGKLPDCVPVAPDFSNMIPARLTGKPFWDLYLYNDPPIHEAYIAAAKYFDIDSLMDGYFRVSFPEDRRVEPWLKMPDGPWEQFIVHRAGDRIVTQLSCVESGKRTWWPKVTVYYRDNPPTHDVHPESIGLPPVPALWEPVEGAKPVDHSPEGLKRVKQLMGDQGLVGLFVVGTGPFDRVEHVYYLYDHIDMIDQWAAERTEEAEKRFRRIMALPEDYRPDFLCVGGSGTLVFQTPEIFRRLSFPAVKRVIELATAAGMPTHIHSCGPEKLLVKIMAEETSLTVIDPLEMPPMGDCDLAELKRLYGDRIVLKGNLHTTDVMLRGTPDNVRAAARKAIDDAGAGGRFILSTGDQCGRDTPDENLRAMVETARTYGKY
ncbi:MAG: uroporphyrinogen decarboxylase family protein [Phycisphaerae bacterium]